MGRIFLQLGVTIWTVLTLSQTFSQQSYCQLSYSQPSLNQELYSQNRDPIFLPPPPKTVPPPRQNPADEDEAFRRHEQRARERKKRLRRQQRGDQPKPLSQAAQENRQLAKDAAAPRPQRFGFEISLIFPDILVSSSRKNYSTDITSHFNFLMRHSKAPNTGNIGLWYGFRLAAFSGSGTYKDVPGRFGFTYFGPMIGLGKVDPPPKDFGQKKAGKLDWADYEFLKQPGWFLTTGLAAQSRHGVIDPSDEEVDDDFDSQGVAFDSPGLWLEARYLFIHYGALHSSYFLGVHTGRGKIFGYFGVGFGGWH